MLIFINANIHFFKRPCLQQLTIDGLIYGQVIKWCFVFCCRGKCTPAKSHMMGRPQNEYSADNIGAHLWSHRIRRQKRRQVLYYTQNDSASIGSLTIRKSSHLSVSESSSFSTINVTRVAIICHGKKLIITLIKSTLTLSDLKPDEFYDLNEAYGTISALAGPCKSSAAPSQLSSCLLSSFATFVFRGNR